MQKRTMLAACALSAALAMTAIAAPTALASEAHAVSKPTDGQIAQSLKDLRPSGRTLALPTESTARAQSADEKLAQVSAEADAARQAKEAREAADKTLSCDPALLAAIGTQESTGHSICCAAFACAIGDAYANGIAQSHAYYGCTCCTWPGWGGGNSSFRDLGSSQALLAEAYEQIRAGKPTVVHVAASYGGHWVTFVGYQNVTDPSALTLDNFICIDPWDGAQVTVSERFSLYGDNCQHISS